MVLSHPLKKENAAAKLTARFISIKGEPHLSICSSYADKDLTRNIPLQDAAEWVSSELGGLYASALLQTTAADWQYSAKRGGGARIIKHKAKTQVPPAREHDQKKETLLDESANDWLRELDVTDANGNVRASMADKYRQINRYLEILSHLVRDCGWLEPKFAEELLLADMGCGKAYLTFGAWHLWTRVWHKPVRIIGVEARPELVSNANALAKKLGATNLEFKSGTIEDAILPKLDALIALHACNTATDDAILRGIDAGAKLIVVAPCCHKEVRPQLGNPEPIAPILQHGVMKERMAEWVTDGLRALFLEWAGYDTKIMEFIDSEHTPKNLMIAGIRNRLPYASDEAREKILSFKSYFGIEKHALDRLLDYVLV
jgi:SAM-dependent methyltransferase